MRRSNRDGLRVIAVAYREFDQRPAQAPHGCDETDMILVGFIAFHPESISGASD